MPRNTTLVLLVTIPALVAGCATQQERCISKHTREYRTVSSLLAEVEGNLARGYAWEERQVVRTRLTQCRDVVRRDKDGNVEVYYRPCWRDYVDNERYRVAIDPAAEERKRDGLVTQKAALSGQAKAYAAACVKAFPEEKA